MGILSLILKQMRQRALGTWLTLLSVLLGVALAIAILLLRDAGQSLFGQTDYGYDVIVGVGKGSATQLVMNTVYHIDVSPGPVPYYVYEALNSQEREGRGSSAFDFHGHVKIAVPVMVGDTYEGRPIVGTLPKMFISLAPLRTEVGSVIDRQDQLNADGDAPNVDAAQLAARQNDLATQAGGLRAQIERADRESVPLTRVPTLESPAPKYQYGDPVAPDVDEIVNEMRAAAQSLANHDARGARPHERKARALLREILASVDAHSGPLDYRPDQAYELAEGRIFHPWKFEAVLGSEVARNTGLRMGSQFQATHGLPPPGTVPDIHPEKWKVVGVLKPTHTAADRCLYIPLISLYTIAEHEQGLGGHANARQGRSTGSAAPAQDDDTPKYRLVPGNQLLPDLPATADYISVDVPTDEWEVSAILVRSRGGVTGEDLRYYVNNGGMKDVQAVSPAQTMRIFFDTFLKSSADILLIISLLVSIVAGVGILVSIYNSVAARTREIAILRALGATRGRVLTLICAEAGLIGLLGSLAGLVAGHAFGGIASAVLNNTVGQGFDWTAVRGDEWLYLLLVVAIALVAGLVPALKAYRTPVATNLVAA